MLKLKPFQEKAYSASATYDCEFSGLPCSKIGLRFDSAVGGAATAIPTDAAHLMLGTPEINQAEQPLIRMAGQSWRLLSAFQRGSFEVYTASATFAQAHAVIDLSRLMPGAMINGADKKIFLRGQFAPLATFTNGGTAPTSLTGTLRPFMESSELDPTAGFMRPRFTESSLPLANAAENQQVFKFEQDTVVSAIMVQAYHASAVDRVDGLIRSVRIDHVGANGQQEVLRARWGTLRTTSAGRAGFDPTNYALAAGAVLIPLIDRGNPRFNNALLLRAGDSLTITYDCTTTVEENFTAVVAASPDVARATVIGWTPVSGSGDTATQVRTIGAPATPVTKTAMTARDRRAIARAQRYGTG